MKEALARLSPRSLREDYVAWLFRLSKRLSRQGLYEWLEAEFQCIRPGSCVLTVGAGGEINELLSRISILKGFRVTSLDIDPDRFPDIEGDVCLDALPSLSYDVVVMAEVLEHLHDPRSGLANVRNTMKDGGRLILTTPFALPIHDAPYDYFRFTKFGLELILSDFRCVEIKARNNYFEAIDVLWVRLLQTHARNAQSLCSVLYPLLFVIKRPLTWALGSLVETEAMTTGYVVTATK